MSNKEIFEQLEWLFQQSKLRFGSVVKSRWMHTEDGCPGCGKKITTMKYKGQNTLSLNTFIYRDHGVLIGYLLCGKCAKEIHKHGPESMVKTPIHDQIEITLKESYLRKSGH